MKVNLGDRVKDRVTGFTGIAVCRTEWLYGCVRIGVKPEKVTKDGKEPEAVSVDEPQLIVVKAAVVANDPFWRETDTARVAPMRRVSGPQPNMATRTVDPR